VADLPKRPGRLEYQRGIYTQSPSGEFEVRATGGQSSGILSSMSQANCFIVLPLDSGRVAAGTLVDIEPFAGLV
jgi:molybdopterin molybdotransferase